jgi:hypothetical protein
MQKLVWRLKLEADFGAGNTTEIEVAGSKGRLGQIPGRSRKTWILPERGETAYGDYSKGNGPCASLHHG